MWKGQTKMSIITNCDKDRFIKFANEFGVKYKIRMKKYIISWRWKELFKWSIFIPLIPLIILARLLEGIAWLILKIIQCCFGEIGAPVVIVRLVEDEGEFLEKAKVKRKCWMKKNKERYIDTIKKERGKWK